MKYLLTAFFFMCVLFLSNISAYADTAQTTVEWEKDNFNIQVYDGTTIGYMYSIFYNGVDTEGVPIGQNAYLLMVDGGFIPMPGIIIKNDRALAPIEIICEALNMEWNTENQTVNIYSDTSDITLMLGKNEALVNGSEASINVGAEIINSITYVPVRFVAETANAKVQFVPNINKLSKAAGTIFDSMAYNEYVNNVLTVVIETNNTPVSAYTVNDGLKAVKTESEKAYGEVTDFLKSQGYSFNDAQKDYDPNAIEYTNFDMGRYYVYQLEGFANCPIFYNKYTGIVFSHHVGLPGVWVEEGFINIHWLYQ